MRSFIYHSPEGDREIPLLKKNDDDTVDLGGKDGLDIGKCSIGNAIGQCSPIEEVAEQKSNHQKK